MRSRLPILALLSALTFVFLPPSAFAAIKGLPQGCEPVDGNFIDLVLNGNSVTGINPASGKTYREYLSGSGRSYLETADGRVQQGEWRVAERGICFRYGGGDWDCKAMGMSECSAGKYRYSYLKLIDGKASITGHISVLSKGDAHSLLAKHERGTVTAQTAAPAVVPGKPAASQKDTERRDVLGASKPCLVTAKRQNILNMFANNTYFGVNAKTGVQFQEFLKSDWRAYVRGSDGTVKEGSWSVTDDQICFDYGKGKGCRFVALIGCTSGGYAAAFAEKEGEVLKARSLVRFSKRGDTESLYADFARQNPKLVKQRATAELFIQASEEQERQKKAEAVRREREAERARQQAASARRDKSKDVCWQIKDESARNACLGNTFLTKSENARNVLLGNCFTMTGSNKDFIVQVCSRGKQGCSISRDTDTAVACSSCNGDRQWLATWAAGVTLRCYK